MNRKIRIKEVCQMCNTTQKELAEKLGVSEVTLSRASNGNTSLSLLDKIACTLGIEISELFAPSNSVQGCCPYCGQPISIKTTIEKV